MCLKLHKAEFLTFDNSNFVFHQLVNNELIKVEQVLQLYFVISGLVYDRSSVISCDIPIYLLYVIGVTE